MDLKSKVVFHLTTERVMQNYTPNGCFVGTHEYRTNVLNIDDFRNFITNFANAAKFGNLDIDKGTYRIKIKRNVIVSDEDDRKYFKSMTFPGQEIVIILSTMNKLLYVSDIEPLLRKKVADFCIGKSKFVENSPVYLESFDGFNVKYRPLANNSITEDVIIDTNLNQIWPENTEKIPVVLTELLSQTTEKVR